MIRKILISLFCTMMFVTMVYAQKRLNLGDVSNIRVANSGNIMRNKKITGYFLLVIKDQLSKDTIRYSLQILDENMHKVREYEYLDAKDVYVCEAASNDSTTAFLLSNSHTGDMELKILDADGQLKFSYKRPYVKGQGKPNIYYSAYHDIRDANHSLFDAGTHGYMAILDVRHRIHTAVFEVNYFDAAKKKHWKYTQPKEAHKEWVAEFMAKTDNLMLLEVTRSRKNNKCTSSLTAFSIESKKKVFELKEKKEAYHLVPSFVMPKPGTDTITVAGEYFKGANKVRGRASKGIGFYDIDSKGNILTSTYNAWNKELSGTLTANKKGKYQGLGYLYLHNMIPGPDGKLFVVGEGYKRVLSSQGVMFNNTKLISTNLVMLEFDGKYHLKRTNVYEKQRITLRDMADFRNIHKMGYASKRYNSFDYKLTTITEDYKNFSICYTDMRRVSKKERGAYHIIRYNGLKFRNDDLPIQKDKTNISIYPAKAGNLLIFETNEKGSSMRMEKVS
ncbi:DUF6770 family protein [Chitinophaga sp. RCC_12]|uniref:DUF6770 family protein n=1 Tax=Chitinophaga sp. RCC_12 TaxID=3239226 RepID=UPI003524574D